MNSESHEEVPPSEAFDILPGEKQGLKVQERPEQRVADEEALERYRKTELKEANIHLDAHAAHALGEYLQKECGARYVRPATNERYVDVEEQVLYSKGPAIKPAKFGSDELVFTFNYFQNPKREETLRLAILSRKELSIILLGNDTYTEDDVLSCREKLHKLNVTEYLEERLKKIFTSEVGLAFAQAIEEQMLSNLDTLQEYFLKLL
jgi:hypothetical protein